MSDRVPASTAAVRWLPTEPFAHLEDIHRRMNRYLQMLTTAPPAAERWSPAADVEETDDEFVIDVELPGASARDVVLEWDDRTLTVRGRIPVREHSGVLHQRTRRTGPLHYTLTLPRPVLGDRMTARLAHGVLTIHAPKAKPGPVRHIHIVDPDESVVLRQR